MQLSTAGPAASASPQSPGHAGRMLPAPCPACRGGERGLQRGLGRAPFPTAPFPGGMAGKGFSAGHLHQPKHPARAIKGEEQRYARWGGRAKPPGWSPGCRPSLASAVRAVPDICSCCDAELQPTGSGKMLLCFSNSRQLAVSLEIAALIRNTLSILSTLRLTTSINSVLVLKRS